MTNITDLEKCSFMIRRGDRATISCSLGLWSVNGAFGNALFSEALHYFQQYKSDGEYSEILGGDNVMETLRKKIDQ